MLDLAVLGEQLGSMLLKGFSNLNGSMTDSKAEDGCVWRHCGAGVDPALVTPPVRA